jgi:hypothetical protein
VQPDRVAPGVAVEQPHGSVVGAQQAEQHPNGGGFARAIRSEESGDVTRSDGQVETVERLGAAERLGQAADFDRSCDRVVLTRSWTRLLEPSLPSLLLL